LLCAIGAAAVQAGAAEPAPNVPRFSVSYMDRSVKPGDDFYLYAAGHWLRDNPVPADKTRWSGFEELRERNWHLIREILETVTADKKSAPGTPARQVGDLFASAMDTNRIERLGYEPIEGDLKRIDRLEDLPELVTLLADFHQADISGFFGAGVSPDAKNSSIYAFELNQGGLSLPDRDYYLKDDFAKQREAYRAHVSRMLTLIGEKETEAAAHAATVLEIETALARGSRIATLPSRRAATATGKTPRIGWIVPSSDSSPSSTTPSTSRGSTTPLAASTPRAIGRS